MFSLSLRDSPPINRQWDDIFIASPFADSPRLFARSCKANKFPPHEQTKQMRIKFNYFRMYSIIEQPMRRIMMRERAIKWIAFLVLIGSQLLPWTSIPLTLGHASKSISNPDSASRGCHVISSRWSGSLARNSFYYLRYNFRIFICLLSIFSLQNVYFLDFHDVYLEIWKRNVIKYSFLLLLFIEFLDQLERNSREKRENFFFYFYQARSATQMP